MYKKILYSIVVLSIIALMTFNVNINSRDNKLSDVSLANIEALAFTELTLLGWVCFNDGYDDYSSDLFFVYVRCNDCYSTTGVNVWGASYCWHQH